MPEKRPEVLDFLLTRRSRPAKTLGLETPDRAELEVMLTAASRTPDHGKLAPWRFIVIRDMARREEIAAMATEHMSRARLDSDKIEKNANSFRFGGVIVAVVATPHATAKIPVWEQELASGGVCLALLNAALASGWGANWLTGPLARDPAFLGDAFGCAAHEFVAGFIHIGNEQIAPADRDRPDIGEITTWL